MFIKYKANRGKVFVRKEDKKIFGTELYVHNTDTLNNYEQKDVTIEELKELKKRGITWD